MRVLHCNKRLYIFEDSFYLTNHDCPEAGETTFSQLSFLFIVDDDSTKIEGCGVRLLESPHCILHGKETEEDECRGINMEANNENAGGEDDEGGDGDNSGPSGTVRLFHDFLSGGGVYDHDLLPGHRSKKMKLENIKESGCDGD